MNDPNSHTDTTELVLVGGGHSHVEVLRQFGMNPLPHVRLTIITKDYHAPYSGMLPGFIAGHYDYDQSHIDLAPLAHFARCRFLHHTVTGIDLEAKELRCENRPPVPFDLLSLNLGSTPAMGDIPGAAEYAIPAKPVDEFVERWKDIRQRAQDAKGIFRILTVGGGAGGVELTLTMHHYLSHQQKDPSANIEFHLATDSPEILPTHNAGVRKRISRVIRERGIHVHTEHRANRVEPQTVSFENGSTLPYDALIWVTDASPAKWIADTGLDLDDRRFIAIDATLASTSHPFVFAAGDVATIMSDPKPKSGVYAVREGPVLFENLRRKLSGIPLERYRPQRRFLSLISTGDKNAIASRGPWSFEGPRIWNWKDRIDTVWMAKYAEDLPEMDMSAPYAMANGEMHCGGCGCKIGAPLLDRVLHRLRKSKAAAEALRHLDQLDDAAILIPPEGKVALRSLDFFRSFIDDPYIFGKVAAHHCLNDIFAMGASPHDALANAVIPYGPESQQESTLFDMLHGAAEVLAEHGAQLVGGHTTEGPELAFGLAVSGYGDKAALLRKAGMQPGDCLILTKPVGTGALFAAAAMGKARGRWIESATTAMLTSNARAAQIFLKSGATACTDVTGFGILGHLHEMLHASGTSAELTLDALPLLPGFDTVVTRGITSTLQPANLQRASAITNAADFQAKPAYAALFDPQTAGGLLGAVPKDRSDACIASLRAAGYDDATLIATVCEKSGNASEITLT